MEPVELERSSARSHPCRVVVFSVSGSHRFVVERFVVERFVVERFELERFELERFELERCRMEQFPVDLAAPGDRAIPWCGRAVIAATALSGASGSDA